MEQLSFDSLEVWKPVLGYEDVYEVSSHGNVRVLTRIDARGWRRKAGMLSPWPRSKGHYLCVTLCLGATEIKRYVHELVLEAFDKPRPEPHYQVRHLDGNPLNNRLTNLAWGTPLENAQDRIRHGRSKRPLSPVCRRGHEYTEANTYWKPSGERRCRQCHNIEQQAAYARKKAA